MEMRGSYWKGMERNGKERVERLPYPLPYPLYLIPPVLLAIVP